jgi:predicted nucleotide-binding protein (sugar kinase/HSP70/actin superfamily)
MSVVVGIPRGLLYYKYFPLWKTFLEGLGAEVILSPQTNRQILEKGLKKADSEICLPVKVFYGHVLEISDQVDFLFIPHMVAVEKTAYTCPKFLGLPDMIRAINADLPPILSPTFNLRLGRRRYYQSFYHLGRQFSTSSLQIGQSLWHALHVQARFEARLRAGSTFEEALISDKRGTHSSSSSKFKVGIAGHSYNITDSFVSLNLLKHLKKREVSVLTTDMAGVAEIEKATRDLPKRLFWTYEKEVIGSALSWIKRKSVDGIIYVLSFACGPDSLMQVVLEQEARKLGKIPLMPMVIDEHTSETGLLTRLEAFLDMIAWQKGDYGVIT